MRLGRRFNHSARLNLRNLLGSDFAPNLCAFLWLYSVDA